MMRMKKSMLNLKRRISVLLAMAMVFTNTVPGLSTVYADESDKSHFEIDAGQLVEAISDAVSDASLLEEEELELTDGETDELWDLLYGEGYVYEIFPEIEQENADTELRMFVRLENEPDIISSIY